MKISDFLKQKFELVFIISISILADIIPIVVIMTGLWIVKYFSRLFGFEENTTIELLMVFEEAFMVILYLVLIVFSIITIYNLFKKGEL